MPPSFRPLFKCVQHLDLEGWEAARIPAAQAALNEIGIPGGKLEESFGEDYPSTEELAYFKIASLWKHTPTLLVLDHTDAVLSTDFGKASIERLLTCLDPSTSAVLVISSSTRDLNTGKFNPTGQTYLGYLSTDSATTFLVDSLAIPRAIAQDAVEIVDPPTLQLGALNSVVVCLLAESERPRDPIEIGLRIEAEARPLRQDQQTPLLNYFQSDADSRVSWLTDAMVGKVREIAFTDGDTELAGFSESGYLSLHNRSWQPMPRFTEACIQFGLNELSTNNHSLAPKIDFHLANSLNTLHQSTRSASSAQARAFLYLRQILRRSQFSRLSLPAIDAMLTEQPFSELIGAPRLELEMANTPGWLHKFVVDTRACKSAHQVRALVEEMSRFDDIRTSGEIAALRRSLIEWQLRFGYTKDVLQAAALICRSVNLPADQDALSTFAHLLADTARAGAEGGDKRLAQELLTRAQVIAHSIPHVERLSIEVCRAEVLGDLTRSSLLRLQSDLAEQVKSGHIPSAVALIRLVKVAAYTFDDGHDVNDFWAKSTAALRKLPATSVFPVFVAVAAAQARQLSRAARDEASRRYMLRTAVSLMYPHESVYELLAEIGDTRTYRTLARCELTLADSLSPDRPQEAERLRRRAIDRMRWSTEVSPTAAAWYDYIRALARSDTDEQPFASDDEDIVWEKNETIHAAIRRYRRWFRLERPVGAAAAEVETTILTSKWKSEGSLVAICEQEEGWRAFPNSKKIFRLRRLFKEREAVIDAVERRCSSSVHVALLRFRNLVEFERARAIHGNCPFPRRRMIAAIEFEMSKVGRHPLLQIEKGRFLRYVWHYEDSISAYRAAYIRQTDPAMLRHFTLGLARALLDSVAFGSLSDELASDRCQEAKRILLPLAGTSSAASILSLVAELNLNGRLQNSTFRDFVNLIADSPSFSDLFSNQMDLLKVLELELEDNPNASSELLILRQFSYPGVLWRLAQLLIRWAEVDPGFSPVLLLAALRCLEGSRIMDSGTRGPMKAFLEAKALIVAARISGQDSSLRWAERTGEGEISDLNLAARRLMSAQALSIGEFREVVEAMGYETRVYHCLSSTRGSRLAIQAVSACQNNTEGLYARLKGWNRVTNTPILPSDSYRHAFDYVRKVLLRRNIDFSDQNMLLKDSVTNGYVLARKEAHFIIYELMRSRIKAGRYSTDEIAQHWTNWLLRKVKRASGWQPSGSPDEWAQLFGFKG